MNLSTRTDIEKPIADVYAALTNFDMWETAALRRGVDVARIDSQRKVATGAQWDVKFMHRGKSREARITVGSMDPDGQISMNVDGKVMDAEAKVELVALAPRRTRIVLHLEVKPRTLGARLFLQSVRLAKQKVQTRLNDRFANFAREIDQRIA